MYRKPNLTETKLLIMRLLKSLEQLDEDQLTEIFSETGLITYFDIRVAVEELKQTELLIGVPMEEGREVYSLTQKGQETYRMFCTTLPIVYRDMIDDLIPEWKRLFARREDVRTSVTRNADDTYTASLEIRENGMLTMDLHLKLESDELARQAAQRLNERAEKVYAGIWSMLYSDSDEKK